jgi:uncharacterized protein (TIGR03089 family)
VSTTSTPIGIWYAARDMGPARPFVTYYDEATGGRVELSYATMDNWVAKTANLVQDELALDPGARVALLLPAHWLAPAWVLACLAVGVVACPNADPAGCDAVVTGPDTLEAARACHGERLVSALLPLGGRLREVPAGFTDLAAVVPGMPDRFAPYQPVDPAAPALWPADAARPWTGVDALEVATRTARARGLDAESRLLVRTPLVTAAQLSTGLLAPVAVGAAVVLSGTTDPDLFAARVKAERITLSYEETGSMPATS